MANGKRAGGIHFSSGLIRIQGGHTIHNHIALCQNTWYINFVLQSSFINRRIIYMRILLLNPMHPAVSSRCHNGGMPPLGLLSIGGPLIDDGHIVRLIDGDIKSIGYQQLAQYAAEWFADAVLIGHSGSTSAHPEALRIAKAIKSLCGSTIVYGGIHPTYHANEILAESPDIDIIVRGEGEQVSADLMKALENHTPLEDIMGLTYKEHNSIRSTPDAPPIANLDNYRIGWELIENWDDYHYWGAGRSAIIQFSRGCPHVCTYCGQRFFWKKWRHRDPIKTASEIALLYHRYRVRFVDLADENPTTSKRLWQQFLEAMIAENVPVQIITTIRASDIVRDADILPLYKKAGFARILLGIETTNLNTQAHIRKNATPETDKKAIQLLRENDILSQAAYVVGFDIETDKDFFHGMCDLVKYDPDQINAMYVTPHHWTPFYAQCTSRKVIEPELSRWDYRHQVLSTAIPPWRVFLWMKLTEAAVQLHPKALWRLVAHRDRNLRRALQWCYGVGLKAWLYEFRRFL